MEYKVRVALIIRSLDGLKWTSGHIDTTLPFAPFEGLVLKNQNWSTKPIERITFDVNSQSFHCITEDREHECDDFTLLDMEFLISEAKRDGWLGFENIYEIDS